MMEEFWVVTERKPELPGRTTLVTNGRVWVRKGEDGSKCREDGVVGRKNEFCMPHVVMEISDTQTGREPDLTRTITRSPDHRRVGNLESHQKGLSRRDW